MTVDFIPYPKIPRLFRDITITEKIDGSNAGIQIIEGAHSVYSFYLDGEPYSVFAQSRKRLITPDDDNFGFAGWVNTNARLLTRTLGTGTHFGEWWGSGIQRNYGFTKGERRFSLFNSKRWAGLTENPEAAAAGLGVVPVLYEGPFVESAIHQTLNVLRLSGSKAAPGFLPPEGIVIFHQAARQNFKVLLENDELPKGLLY